MKSQSVASGNQPKRGCCCWKAGPINVRGGGGPPQLRTRLRDSACRRGPRNVEGPTYPSRTLLLWGKPTSVTLSCYNLDGSMGDRDEVTPGGYLSLWRVEMLISFLFSVGVRCWVIDPSLRSPRFLFYFKLLKIKEREHLYNLASRSKSKSLGFS